MLFCQAKSVQNNILWDGNCSHSALWDRSLAFARSVTSCGQQHIQRKGSGQNNHRQISSRLTQPGWTSRFFQDSIRAWIMTGRSGTQSYLDHCGARVIEFEGRRERWWNGVRRAIVTVGAAEDREDSVRDPAFVNRFTPHVQRNNSTNTTETNLNEILAPLRWRELMSSQ